jgi:adenylate cyclase
VAAGQEIERKFVLSEPPPFDLNDYEGEEIHQGYLAIGDDGTEVRLRARGHARLLTVKSGPGGTRVEEEIELGGDRFDTLWPLTEGRRIEKRRYVVPAGEELSIELDVYGGKLDGLVVAEIEFPSEDAARDYEPPSWLGRDVTGHAAYSNQTLATRGRPDSDS